MRSAAAPTWWPRYTAEFAEGAVAQRIVADVVARWGHLDGLVACAEITGSVPAVDMSMAEWARVLNVNLRGTFVYCKAVVPALLARGRGAIVVTSSHLAYEGAPGATHYAATKGAIESLMRSLACALGPHGIRVNALAPGPSETSDLGPRRAELAYASRLAGSVRRRKSPQASPIYSLRRGGLYDRPGTPRQWRLHHAVSRSARFRSTACF